MSPRDKATPDEDGYLNADFTMEMDFDDLLGHDIDTLNDAACDAWGSHDLQDINYETVGTKGFQLIVRVTGYEKMEDEV